MNTRLANLMVIAALCVSAQPALAQAAPQTLHFSRQLAIGAADGEGALSDVAGLAVDAAGTMYVLERMERRVSVFAPDGRLLRRFGKRGQGPGEFETPMSIGLHSDTLWVSDRALKRITLMSPTGLVYRTIFNDSLPPSVLFSDGSIGHVPTFEAQFVAETSPVCLSRISEAGQRILTVACVPFGQRVFRRQIADGASVATNPFTDAPILVRSASGIAVVRQDGSNDERGRFTVTRLGLRGDTLYSSEFTVVLVAVTPKLLDERFPESEAAPARRENLRFLKSEILRTVKFVPPVAGAVLGEDGRVWVRRRLPNRRGSHYVAIDPAGRLEGNVSFDGEATVLYSRGNTVWVREVGDLDVPQLTIWTRTMSRSGGS
jgi:hypothetical protein